MGCVSWCVDGAAVRVYYRTSYQAVTDSTPGQGVIKSPRSTQPSIPPEYVNRVLALLAGIKAGCVRLCRVTK